MFFIVEVVPSHTRTLLSHIKKEFLYENSVFLAILWVTALTPGIHVLMHAITGKYLGRFS